MSRGYNKYFEQRTLLHPFGNINPKDAPKTTLSNGNTYFKTSIRIRFI